jgi:light-regulated signal transduction histidine kinase (bacteriophytochrome)/CheY-like chemotaxis protein
MNGVDLSNCDREPIHTPGCVQPHGVLLALSEPDLVVRHASDNAAAVLGVGHHDLLGRGLDALLGPGARAALAAPDLRPANPLPVAVRGRRFDGIAHRHDGLLFLELEPEQSAPLGDSDRLVRFAVARLQGELRVRDYCRALAAEARTITGFDRVLVYRFDHEWNGEVIAEEKRADLEPFLGLHYPASDIPAQARRLYTANPVRHIADVTYRAAAVVPAARPDGRPLDLSFAVLRSVSPIHVEYLKNMGVAASLSISILKGGELWGLIACHHYAPRHVPYRVRAACEFLGLITSLQLSARLDSEELRCRVETQERHARLLNRMSAGGDWAAALTAAGDDLLGLTRAGGAAVVHDGKCLLAGRTPAADEVRAVAGWLRAAPGGDLFATHALPAAFPPAAGSADTAAGVLAVPLSADRADWLLWFRPEAVRTVDWAGDPRKAYAVGPNGPRLSPRGSFALWQEVQRGKSEPWEECEAGAARKLREGVAAAALRQVAELRHAARRKDEFVAVLAHELRNPLGVITNALALAGRSPRPDHQDWAKRVIGQQVGYFSRLIEDLLDVSRATRGKIRLAPEPVDLGDAVRRAVEVVRPLASERRHELAVSVPDAPVRVRADPTRLQQILVNLLTNAAKYTPEGGAVAVAAGRDGDGAVVRVRDTGVGIPADLLPELFDLFTQADRTLDLAKGGLGIGLTLARKLAELHGGTVTAASDGAGKGSEFTLRLPVDAEHGRGPALAPPAADPRPPAPSPRSPKRVLVVDDNVDSSDSLAEVLRLSGHDARAVHTGRAAVEAARADPPEVVLLDIGLPDLDGYRVAAELRKLDGLQDALIVAVTGYAGEEVRDRARRAGFDLHRVKPVDLDDVLALVARGRPAPGGG